MLSDELIIKIFKESVEVSPSHIIKAPGRVNLIGEHIKELYYETYFVEKHPDLLEFSDFDTTILFAVKPSQGAVVKKL